MQNHTLRRWIRRIAALAALALAVHVAPAQLTPDRLYYGIDRKIPMTVRAPEGGDVVIKLLSPGSAEEVASAPAVAGGVDLASLFPVLWETDEPGVLYAQLQVDGSPLGSAVVLQPLVAPDLAQLLDPTTMTPSADPRRAMPIFESDRLRMMNQPPRPRPYSGIRAYVDRDVVLETSHGDIRFRLRPDEAPNTAFNFRHLVEGGFYTDIIFHRIIPPRGGRPGFVVQVGDPTGTGSGGPGYYIDLENTKLPHDFGVLSMARSSDPDSGGSQVFICLSREATSALDRRYTSFGEAIAGADTIASLGSVEVEGDRPVDPPVLERAYLVDAAPYGTGPGPVKRPEGVTETPKTER